MAEIVMNIVAVCVCLCLCVCVCVHEMHHRTC